MLSEPKLIACAVRHMRHNLTRGEIIDALLYHSRAFVATGHNYYRQTAFAYAVILNSANYAIRHIERLNRLRDYANLYHANRAASKRRAAP
jgi:hypothetical protein